MQAAYRAMQLTAWSVLIPLALASLATGIVQSLGTKWGLVRHYWVLAKLIITILATVVLLLYTQTLDYLAGVAAQTTLSTHDLDVLQTPTVVLHASVALLLLVVATTLAVYKPPGTTRHGSHKHLKRQAPSQP